MRFVVCTGFRDGLRHLVEDVQPSGFSLLQGLFEDLVGEPPDLDVHLAGRDAFAGAGYFKVHITKVVFVAEDVRKNGVFA